MNALNPSYWSKITLVLAFIGWSPWLTTRGQTEISPCLSHVGSKYLTRKIHNQGSLLMLCYNGISSSTKEHLKYLESLTKSLALPLTYSPYCMESVSRYCEKSDVLLNKIHRSTSPVVTSLVSLCWKRLPGTSFEHP
ncbi:unnamed protein product [Blepharisma stoltei]|uniref:Uncharacterized protein n=1 Tax=Blepharisma stoltei TaxID=1481888 RepID=A0AAU9J8C0_9CILI|nr:unnamed protein product [Blepharisma stoltei]